MSGYVLEGLYELKQRIESANAMLTMTSLPDSIHIASFRELVPEYIEDLDNMINELEKERGK